MIQRLTVFSLCILSLQGCASFGYGVGRTSATIGRDGSSIGQSLASSKEMTYASSYHQFRIVDTSGILLSALVSTARQAEAKQRAIDNAVSQGKKAGTLIEYSYEPMPIIPGMRVTADLRLGFGAKQMTYSAVPGFEPVWTSDEGSYLAIDVSGELVNWRPAVLPISITGGFSALIDRMSAGGPNVGPSAEFYTSGSDLYATVKAGWEPTGNLAVVGTAHLGLVSPLMYALIGTEETPALATWGGLEASWRPIKYLSVIAELRVGRYPSLQREVRQTMAGVNALVSF